jgi:hypothetical protein
MDHEHAHFRRWHLWRPALLAASGNKQSGHSRANQTNTWMHFVFGPVEVDSAAGEVALV